jgi:hypothetical protein
LFAIEIEAKVNTAIKIILTKDDDDSDTEWGIRNFIEGLEDNISSK